MNTISHYTPLSAKINGVRVIDLAVNKRTSNNLALVQLGNTGTSLLYHQRLEMAVNVVRRTSVKMKRKHPYYYLAMKVAAFITTFILFGFIWFCRGVDR